MPELPVASVSPAPEGWHRFTTAADPGPSQQSTVLYGSDVATEADLRLLGKVDGRRVLDLGCGTGANAVVLARQGAKVLAVDPGAERLGVARERAESAEVRVELHQAELAELPFLRSDSVDLTLSVMALATADDLARVFRQVHRVLKPEAAFVLSLPHPAFTMLDPRGEDPLRVTRPYDYPQSLAWQLGDEDVLDYPRTIGDVFTTLWRSSFGVDHLLELTATQVGHPGESTADLARVVPSTLLIRARKQGN